MADTLESVRQLRMVLVRLGARPAARYWSNPLHIFAGNFAGGAIAGVAASIIAAAILGFDAHRAGTHSTLFHFLRMFQAFLETVRMRIEQEMGG